MKLVSCGEALIDLIRDSSDAQNASVWKAHCGGGPYNTAIAMAKLGLPAYFMGRLSSDTFGEQLRAGLDQAGVRTDLTVACDEPTSLAVVSLDDDGVAQYTFHFSGTSNFGWQPHEFTPLAEDDWLHCGSISTIVQPGAQAIIDYVSQSPARVSFDVNVRPTVQPDMERYRRDVLAIVDVVGSKGGVVKASDEDISLLVNQPDQHLEFARECVRDRGVSVFLVTLGAQGAVAVTPDGEVTVPGHQVTLGDTVGAGDTFMAGFLSRYVRDAADVEGALRAGAAAAALVCTRIGANPPTADELAEFMQ